MKLRLKKLAPPICLASIVISLIIFNQSSQPPNEPDDIPDFSVSSPPRESEYPMQWQVKSIYDADTLTVVRGSEEKTIRLCGIDAPEIGQPLGVEARDSLRNILIGQNVHIEKVNEDQYGRTVAEVIFWDGNIGVDLTRSGYAWVWDRYAPDCPRYEELKKASNEAKSDQVGVFSSDSHIEPWIWRQRN